MTEEEVFLAVLELPGEAARAAYLDETCGSNTALRRQVDALLAAHFRSGEFLDVSAPEQVHMGTNASSPATIQSDAMPGETNPDGDDEGLPFLEAPTRPGSLGRIGHYEVLQVLGKGGFSIVFRAFDDTLQRIVAIKVMAPQLAATSPARKRFLREARSSAQVRHENVVQVYEVNEVPLPYLAMEFIPGETLQQRLDRLGPLEVQEVLRIGRQIAEGLAAAHATDLIHRDIKPGNVLLEGGQYKVKITDFGLARAADDASMTQSGMIAGTPMYMAPEQALGQTLDQRADLFSLGSVLYQTLAGRPPFRANTTIAVLKRVAEDTPRPIREVIPETPQWLCDIITKLHAKDPADRYQSAREVADVLADCEAQLKSNSRLQDFSRIPRPARTSSANWMRIAVAAAVLLPIIALMTEFAGITNLFQSQATRDSIKPAIVHTPVAVKESDAQGWVQLFNGQDLTGWRTYSGQPGGWKVENGSLVGSGDSGPLFSERGDYENFQLRVEATFLGGMDSGQFIRTTLSASPIDGYEAQIGQGTGSLFRCGTPEIVLHTSKDPVPPNTWFTQEIIAAGHRLTVKVDGQTVVETTDTHYARGHIALANFKQRGTVQFRKIEIKELPASTDPAQPPITVATEQVEKVRKELMRLNPGFDGQVGHRIEDDVVVQFSIVTDQVTDISPVRALTGLKSLSCSGSDVGLGQLSATALLPLKGLPLTQLDLRDSPAVSDLAALAGMKLISLDCRATSVGDADLKHLAGMNDLQMLSLWGTQVTDAGLKELAGLKNLEHLCLQTTKVTDAGLKEIVGLDKLVYLDLYALSGVTDAGLEQLARLKALKHLDLRGPTVNDADVDKLASARPALRIVTWNRVIEPKVVPFTDADAQRIAALPAEQQVEEVRKELMRLNSGFDGKVTPTIENDVVTELSVNTDQVTNIAPVRALTELVYLDCRGTYPNKGILYDLSPIKGMKLSQIDCSSTQIADLTPLADMPLTNLQFNHNPVDDLTPLKGMLSLATLGCAETKISDFSPLKGLKLKSLGAQLLAVTDLSPLEGMPLTGIDLYHSIGVTSLAPLKGMPLEGLNLHDVPVSDLSPLAGMTTLRTLVLHGCKVSDLSPLAGLKLTDLLLHDKQITDLSPLKGLPLSRLTIDGTGVSDLTPLQGMPLAEIRLTPQNITQGLDILRDIKSLKIIGVDGTLAWDPAGFWQRYEKGEFK